VSFWTAGGGGYGDPATRDPRQIETDLRDGYVTPGSAARDYGYQEGTS
jgi:N-methylhydantoinase B